MQEHEIDVVPGRCRICGDSAPVLRLTEFNLKVCEPCFLRFLERRVRRTIEKHGMIGEGDRVVLALSGGKDSAALLFALRRLGVVMGFELSALHFHLNMGDYSDRNLVVVEDQAKAAGVPLEVKRISDLGLQVRRVKGWHPCAVCGAIKRSLMNREAKRLGATVVATAHTLEDVLLFTFKNLFSRKFYVPQPVLPASGELSRKVKPLIYNHERMNLSYCRLKGVPVFEERCPEWTPRGHSFKDVLEHMEEVMPSSKLRLLLSLQEAIPAGGDLHEGEHTACESCGEPTSQRLCALCQLSNWFARRTDHDDSYNGV